MLVHNKLHRVLHRLLLGAESLGSNRVSDRLRVVIRHKHLAEILASSRIPHGKRCGDVGVRVPTSHNESLPLPALAKNLIVTASLGRIEFHIDTNCFQIPLDRSIDEIILWVRAVQKFCFEA